MNYILVLHKYLFQYFYFCISFGIYSTTKLSKYITLLPLTYTISAEEATAALHYIAPGETAKSPMFLLRQYENIISQFMASVCEAIYKSFAPKVMKIMNSEEIRIT